MSQYQTLEASIMAEIAANRDFLAENPVVETLVSTVQWPLQTWSNWEGAMKEDNSDRAIERIAATWIEENRETYEGWLETAKAAVGE